MIGMTVRFIPKIGPDGRAQAANVRRS
jgi:hypothetical protein